MENESYTKNMKEMRAKGVKALNCLEKIFSNLYNNSRSFQVQAANESSSPGFGGFLLRSLLIFLRSLFAPSLGLDLEFVDTSAGIPDIKAEKESQYREIIEIRETVQALSIIASDARDAINASDRNAKLFNSFLHDYIDDKLPFGMCFFRTIKEMDLSRNDYDYDQLRTAFCKYFNDNENELYEIIRAAIKAPSAPES